MLSGLVMKMNLWQPWMYYLTLFRYLLEGFLRVAVNVREVRCASKEFTRFAAPPGQTCQSYTEAFVQTAGGYVQDVADMVCEFCQYANGDQFVSFHHRFRCLSGCGQS